MASVIPVLSSSINFEAQEFSQTDQTDETYVLTVNQRIIAIFLTPMMILLVVWVTRVLYKKLRRRQGRSSLIEFENMEFSKLRIRPRLTYCDARGMYVHRGACKAPPTYRTVDIEANRPDPPSYRPYREPPPAYLGCSGTRYELDTLRQKGLCRPCLCTLPPPSRSRS